MKFPISSEHCLVLAALAELDSAQSVASYLNKDPSVISRTLNKIKATTELLDKINGKWKITPTGMEIVHWTKATLTEQKRILKQPISISIASTREFSARVISPQLDQILNLHKNISINLIATQESVDNIYDGVEPAILSGKADIGFDCGRPVDPQIKFIRLIPEPFVITCSPKFKKAHKISSVETLIKLPHLRYDRLRPENLLKLNKTIRLPVAQFNDLASQREATIAGLGWSILPQYLIQREITSKKLVVLNLMKMPQEFFGIWYLRNRTDLKPFVSLLAQWLQNQKL